MNDSKPIIRVPLSMKEGEAMMWCLGQIVNYPKRVPEHDTDPLRVLLNAGHLRKDINKTGEAMFHMVYNHWISEPLTPLEKDILRVCIENTTWVACYTQNSPGEVKDCLRVLREFAAKLEAFNIEISHIPDD